MVRPVEKVVVVAAKGSPLTRRRQLSLTDLHDERWVLHPPDTPAGHLAAELFHTAGLKVPRAPVLTLSIHLGLKLAATAPGITASAFFPKGMFTVTDLSEGMLEVAAENAARRGIKNFQTRQCDGGRGSQYGHARDSTHVALFLASPSSG